jgi:hypothetical protein
LAWRAAPEAKTSAQVRAVLALAATRGANCEAITKGCLFSMLVFAIAMSGQQATTRPNSPADVIYTQPGQLVDVGGFRLNLYCLGSGSPTVIFDSGYEDWARAWSRTVPSTF